MLRTREHEGKAEVIRHAAPRRHNVFDALFQPAFPELTIARGLIRALTPIIAEAAAYTPSVELSENDGNYVVDFSLPGFRKEDIDVEIAGNEVAVTGRYGRMREDAKTHYTEMQQASFTRSIALPQEIDVDRVAATLEDGILRITAPPVTKISARKVPIGAAQNGTGSSATAQNGGKS